MKPSLLTLFLALFDGLDSLIEWLIPGAKDYPIALMVYLLFLAIPVVVIIVVARVLLRFSSEEERLAEVQQ
jgi:hypothetical protein